ncbi:MAG: hypothetical protein MI919_03960 [Holophagales bacterium]|nr:hypothetical protein [Holophagales bacterium]
MRWVTFESLLHELIQELLADGPSSTLVDPDRLWRLGGHAEAPATN